MAQNSWQTKQTQRWFASIKEARCHTHAKCERLPSTRWQTRNAQERLPALSLRRNRWDHSNNRFLRKDPTLPCTWNLVFATKYWRQYTRAKLFPQHSHPSQRESSQHHVGQRQKTASLVRTRAKLVLMSMQIATSPKRNRTWFSPISTLSLDTSPTKKPSFVLSNQQAGFQV